MIKFLTRRIAESAIAISVLGGVSQVTIKEVVKQSHELEEVWRALTERWPGFVRTMENIPVLAHCKGDPKDVLGRAYLDPDEIWFKQVPPNPNTFVHELIHVMAGTHDEFLTCVLTSAILEGAWPLATEIVGRLRLAWPAENRPGALQVKLEIEDELGEPLELVVDFLTRANLRDMEVKTVKDYARLTVEEFYARLLEGLFIEGSEFDQAREQWKDRARRLGIDIGEREYDSG